MRGSKAKLLRRLTREHTPGLPLRQLQTVTTHPVRYVHHLDKNGEPVYEWARVVNPIRLVNDCTRRQYQVNKQFYARMRRGEQAVFHG